MLPIRTFKGIQGHSRSRCMSMTCIEIHPWTSLRPIRCHSNFTDNNWFGSRCSALFSNSPMDDWLSGLASGGVRRLPRRRAPHGAPCTRKCHCLSYNVVRHISCNWSTGDRRVYGKRARLQTMASRMLKHITVRSTVNSCWSVGVRIECSRVQSRSNCRHRRQGV